MEREGMKRVSSTATLCRLLDHFWGIIATALSLLYTAILLWPAALASMFSNGHFCSPIFRLWARLIFRTFGLSVELVGMENLRGVSSFVLVSNHQSLFDILAILLLIPREMRFLAKREIKKVPVLGFLLERSENIVIDRASGGKTIRRALAVADHGYSICVFAEGHRFSDNAVHEFNEGAAWLAIATKLPCIPIAVRGTAEVMPPGARFALPWRRIRLVVRAPISTVGLKSADRVKLTRRLQLEVDAAFRCAALPANATSDRR
jgi:1-acyl-sn-glycerol-3-phosphate acyltransferase